MTSLSVSVCTDNVPRLSGRAHLENAIYREERNTTWIHLCAMATNHNLAKVHSFFALGHRCDQLVQVRKELEPSGPKSQERV